MGSWFKEILDWSEAWAPLIPLIVWFRNRKQQPAFIQPVVFYVWAALVIDIAIDITWKFNRWIPKPWNSNNWLYNLHSIVRFGSFSVFFMWLRTSLGFLRGVVIGSFVVFVVINFTFNENFFDYLNLSNRTLAMEAGLLLFDCLNYFFFKVRQDEVIENDQPDFWIVTGLGIYVAINFFIFLLYKELSIYDYFFALKVWYVHNVSFIVFNLLIAKAFYVSPRSRY